MTKLILVTQDNQIRLEGDRIGYGNTWFHGRNKGWETYKVRLSANATKWVEIDDTIEWRDCGSSDGCHQGCGGEIIKHNSKARIQLTGSRDLGIDTGHSPHLGLKMIQKWKCDYDFCYQNHLPSLPYSVAVSPSGKEFALWATDNLSDMIMISKIEIEREEFHFNKLVARENNWHLIKYNHQTYPGGWSTYNLGWVKKVIKLRDTDKVLIKY